MNTTHFHQKSSPRVYALTGDICSGKSTVLYSFGLLGARILNVDHVLAKTDERIDDFIIDKIEEFRKADNNLVLILEIQIPMADKFNDKFDGIILIETKEKNRLNRQIERDGASRPRHFLSSTPLFTLTNDGSKADLHEKISKIWSKFS